jgi:hypothetical protein
MKQQPCTTEDRSWQLSWPAVTALAVSCLATSVLLCLLQEGRDEDFFPYLLRQPTEYQYALPTGQWENFAAALSKLHVWLSLLQCGTQALVLWGLHASISKRSLGVFLLLSVLYASSLVLFFFATLQYNVSSLAIPYISIPPGKLEPLLPLAYELALFAYASASVLHTSALNEVTCSTTDEEARTSFGTAVTCIAVAVALKIALATYTAETATQCRAMAALARQPHTPSLPCRMEVMDIDGPTAHAVRLLLLYGAVCACRPVRALRLSYQMVEMPHASCSRERAGGWIAQPEVGALTLRVSQAFAALMVYTGWYFWWGQCVDTQAGGMAFVMPGRLLVRPVGLLLNNLLGGGTAVHCLVLWSWTSMQALGVILLSTFCATCANAIYRESLTKRILAWLVIAWHCLIIVHHTLMPSPFATTFGLGRPFHAGIVTSMALHMTLFFAFGYDSGYFSSMSLHPLVHSVLVPVYLLLLHHVNACRNLPHLNDDWNLGLSFVDAWFSATCKPFDALAPAFDAEALWFWYTPISMLIINGLLFFCASRLEFVQLTVHGHGDARMLLP